MYEIRHARSFQNGIVFYSNIFTNKGVKTYYDDNDEIKTEIISDGYTPTSEGSEEIFKNRKRYLKQASILSGIAIGLSIVFLKNFHFILAAIWFAVYLSKDLVTMFHIIINVRKENNKGRTISRFHSAEHMVINAYQSLKKIPTIEEVKKQSRLSNNCGSLILIRKVVYFSMLCLITPVCGINIPLYIVLMIALVILIRTLGQRPGMLKFLEYLFLSKPTDSEIILAIEGIKAYHDLESHIKKNVEKYPIPSFIIFRVVSSKNDDSGENKNL